MMIKCSECGRDISSNAAVCPNCGNPISQPNNNVPVSSDNKGLLVKKLVCITAYACMILGAILPFIKVSFLGTNVSKTLIDGTDGVIIIAIAAVGILTAFIKSKGLSIVWAVISIGVCILEVTYNVNDNSEYSALIQHGTGYYFLLIAAIMLFVNVICILATKSQK